MKLKIKLRSFKINNKETKKSMKNFPFCFKLNFSKTLNKMTYHIIIIQHLLVNWKYSISRVMYVDGGQ